MAEPIKQEIINSIYENGEQLITGPVLQEVLLDMVNDYNAKDAALSSSVAEAIEAIPIVDPTVLATTESLNQLSESLSEAIPDVSGLATTESVNQLSESVAEAIADIPQPDLSGYATTQSVNEATESVKEWVEGKHYLTSASLSGSVTEETVGFMINDATASVKEWVESQSYATETFVSESIAGLDIPDTSGLATTESLNNLSESVAETIANLPQTDLSGYLTTESYNQDSASFDERINAITGSEPIDLSGYATTASLNSLSESVASDFANLDIPDVSTLATTESVLELSESLASMDEIINDHSSELEGLENVKSALEDTGIVYWDEEEETYVAPERVSQEDFTQFSESVANDVAELSESIANIPTGSTPQDLSGYLTTASYQIDSASFDERINAIVVPDLSTYATTASVNELSESLAAVDEIINDHSSELESLESAKSALEEAGIISWDEEEQTYVGNEKVSTEDFTNFSESVASDLESIQSEIPDVSGYATTQSLNSVSQSLSASIAAITSSGGGDYLPLTGGDLQNTSGNDTVLDVRSPEVDTEVVISAPDDYEGVSQIQMLHNQQEQGVTLRSDGTFSRRWFNEDDQDYVEDDFSLPEEGGTLATQEHVGGAIADFSESVAADFSTINSRINDIIVSSGSLWEAGTGLHAIKMPDERSDSYPNDASGTGSLAIGKGSKASGKFSFALGFDCKARGNQSVAQGGGTVASGGLSHAEGLETVAKGHGGHAEGYLTYVDGDYSGSDSLQDSWWGAHAEGEMTRTQNRGAHAEGYLTTASGMYSHAEGRNTLATNRTEHAQGRYNATASGQLFSVGVGHSTASRKNAVSIITGSGETPSASVYIYGVGGYDGTNPNPGTNDIATVIRNMGAQDLSIYATTASLNSVSQSASETKNTVDQITNTNGWMNQSDPLGQKLQTLLNYQGGYSLVTWNGWSYELNLDRFATTQSLNNVSQSLSASIAASGGDDANLRNYLFGTGSTGGTISPASASNWVWTVSQSATFTLDGEIGEGKSIQVIVFNNSVSESVISFNSAYYGPDSVVNGVAGTGSFSIPAGTYGDIVATQIGNKVYFRTSVDLSKIEVDLSGYATTASLNSVSESLSASIAAITSSGGGGGDYLPLTGGTLRNDEGDYPLYTTLDVEAPSGEYESEDRDIPRVTLSTENPDYLDGHASIVLHEVDGKQVTIRGEGTITFNIPESEEGADDGAEMTFNFPDEGSDDDTLATRGWVSEEISTFSESVAQAIEELDYYPWKDWGSVSGNTVLFVSDSRVISNNNYTVSSDLTLILGSLPAGSTACANFQNLSGATVTLNLPATNVDGKTLVYNCLPGSSSMHLMPYAWAPLVCTAINDTVILCSFPQEVI